MISHKYETIAHLKKSCSFKNKYVWFYQWNSHTSPLRVVKSSLCSAKGDNTFIPSLCYLHLPNRNYYLFLSTKSWKNSSSSLSQSVKKNYGTKERTLSWTGPDQMFCRISNIRVQRRWWSDYLLWLLACPWKPVKLEYHSCGVKEGCPQHAASRDYLRNQKEQHCTPYKGTPGLLRDKVPLLVQRQSFRQLEGSLVPRKQEEKRWPLLFEKKRKQEWSI